MICPRCGLPDSYRGQGDGIGSDVAHAVLIAHSRYRIQDCRCGWAELGKSHAAHVLRELAAAMKEANRD